MDDDRNGRWQWMGVGFGAWAVIAVLLIVILGGLSGCATTPRCAVQGEQVQRVGENSAGDYVQIRSFVELCKGTI